MTNKIIRCGGSLVNQWHVVTAGHCVARARPNQVSSKLTRSKFQVPWRQGEDGIDGHAAAENVKSQKDSADHTVTAKGLTIKTGTGTAVCKNPYISPGHFRKYVFILKDFLNLKETLDKNTSVTGKWNV